MISNSILLLLELRIYGFALGLRLHTFATKHPPASKQKPYQ
nr:MAG TPA: hypothetical protein [Caudoviricetes sp.]